MDAKEIFNEMDAMLAKHEPLIMKICPCILRDYNEIKEKHLATG